MAGKVECEVEYISLKSESGRMIDGVEVTCSRCGHTTQSYGTSESSIKRALACLREECPEGETNFYVSDEE